MTKTAQASFMLGVGTMGLIAGLGIGAKGPNKTALLVGVGSLIYANYLNPVLRTDEFVRAEFSRSADRARAAAPDVTSWSPPSSVQVNVR